MTLEVRDLGKFVFILLLVGGVASAASVTIGTANAVNAIPFAYSAGLASPYQQVYSSSAFPNSINIGSISFFLTPVAGGHDQLESSHLN